jgi:adenosylhomocysteine nucleosidase
MKGEGRSEKCEAAALVCFAMKEEAVPFRNISGGRPGISILVTGIGRRNSENAVQNFLANNSPGYVLTCGYAGGLDPARKIGDVVFFTEDDVLRSRLLKAGAVAARFFCADRIAITVGEKRELRERTSADVVEMESEAIHKICRDRGIPCATVRVISDTANEDLPLDFNQLSRPDMSLDFGKLALAVAKSPGKIGALLRLQKHTRLAGEALAATLAKVIL